MAKLLAIEWDARELRAVAGRSHGSSFRADHVWETPLPSAAGAEQVGAALAELPVKGSSPIISICRRLLEMRAVDLPATPTEEQPDLVRFQAPREFSAFDDTWRIDFVEVARSDEKVEVLAAALPPQNSAALSEICLPAQLTAKRMVVRPLAAAELAHDLPPVRRVILSPGHDDANLIIHDRGQVVAARNIRLPADAQQRAAALRAEVARTLALARARFADQEVEELLVLGDEEEHAAWLAQWTAPIAVRHLNPLPAGMSPHPGRFASLVGALQAEAAERRPAIDLLNPRQRPKPKSKINRAAVLAAAVAVLVVGAVSMLISSLRAQDREIKRLALELASRQEKLLPEAEKTVELRDTVRKYFQRDANWLEELRHVSAKVPQDVESVRLTKWVGRANDRTDTEIHLEGGAETAATIDAMEASLRAEGRAVSGDGGDFDENKEPRPWRFRDKISLAASEEPHLLQRALEKTPPEATRVAADARQLQANSEEDSDKKAGDAEDKSEGDTEDKSEGDAEDKSEGDAEDKSEGDTEDKSEGDAEETSEEKSTGEKSEDSAEGKGEAATKSAEGSSEGGDAEGASKGDASAERETSADSSAEQEAEATDPKEEETTS